MRAGGVAYVILGALRAEPKSGYEIKRLVDKATRVFWAASYGQIYPELRRLRDDGLIEALAGACAHHPRRTMAVWGVVVAAALAATAILLGGSLTTGGAPTNSPDSK